MLGPMPALPAAGGREPARNVCRGLNATPVAHNLHAGCSQHSRKGSVKVSAISGARSAGGSLIVVVALLAATSCAKADELSELRANGQLLQQRLNEVSRMQAEPAAGAGDNTASIAKIRGAFPRSFLIPGTNTSVSIGGSVSESFGYRVDGR